MISSNIPYFLSQIIAQKSEISFKMGMKNKLNFAFALNLKGSTFTVIFITKIQIHSCIGRHVYSAYFQLSWGYSI
jgi:hypothetical protein